MKKLVSVALSAALAFGAVASFASCEKKTYKVGLICLHGDSSTYDKNFIDAMKEACANKGLSNDVKIVTNIPEGDKCYTTAKNLVDQGCEVIFADSFGHESYMKQAAEQFPNVEFCHATGVSALTSGLSNFHNAFASIYEGRYLAGYAAGMKIMEMVANETLPEGVTTDANGNYHMGYVGAWTYAEVVSGYTSFYLGAKAALVEAGVSYGLEMDVQFTGSWYDETEEKNSANALINAHSYKNADGEDVACPKAVLISQHADSMGAPTACEVAGVPNVSYNGSTADACPNTFIISSKINWVPYFEHMIDCVINKKGTLETDYCGGLSAGTEYNAKDGSVALTDVGAAAAAGTAEKLNAVMAELKAGTRYVYDVSTFTVKGETLTSMAVKDTDAFNTFVNPDLNVIVTAGEISYFAESLLGEGNNVARSAPYFALQIDGINLLNTKF